MKEKLEKNLKNAYSPVYNYPVSSIIVMKDGKEFIGVNVETMSPAAGICAERNALYNAFSNGYKKGDVAHIHVMNNTDKYSYPCFICRQALSDLCDKETLVTVYKKNGENNTVKINQLCTYPFSKENF